MPDLYVTAENLKAVAVASDAEGDNTVWDLLAESVSRLFDRECEVPNGFFNEQGGATVSRSFTANGTRYLRVAPYVAGSIEAIEIGGVDYFDAVAANRRYTEREGYLVFDFEITEGALIAVSALYGFANIPAEVQQACVEQALMMWRRKDLTFAEISGVPTAAVVAEFSPTFIAVTKRYRDIYSPNGYFV